MKVIQQLIAHFEQKGRLTRRHLEQFVARGYWGHYTSDDLRSLEHQVGDSFFFEATGDTFGPLWGVDTYTSDSNLGAACVHAGLLRPGESGIVKVTFVKPPDTFQGSARNGITSHVWNNGWSGAFRLDRPSIEA